MENWLLSITHFLGFRHGPKSIVNDKTAIVCMMSNNPYTRIYELDLLKEFKNEGGKKKIIVLDTVCDEEVKITVIILLIC